MSTLRLPYVIAGHRLPTSLAWALETGLWAKPKREGVAESLADALRNNLALYSYEHMVGATDELVHAPGGSDHLARALVCSTESGAPLELGAVVVLGRNSYDAPLLLENSRAGAVRIVYLRETSDHVRRWVTLGTPEQLFAALWPGEAGPPASWIAAGPRPRRWSIRGFMLPPALSRMLCSGCWRSPNEIEVLPLAQMYARAVELGRDQSTRNLLAIACVADGEVCLDYAAADRSSPTAAPTVVLAAPGASPRIMADDFAEWATGYWPADAEDAASEAPLFGAPDVPLRTAPELWMPGVDPD